MKKGGASADQIASINAPEHLGALLKQFNGGFHFVECYQGLSVDEIKAAQSKCGNLLPFAQDKMSEENYLAIDLSSGQV